MKTQFLASLAEHILEKGLRLGDTIRIGPMTGQSRKIILNRTSYYIKAAKSNSFQIFGNTIQIPSGQTSESIYQLELYTENLESRPDESCRYFLEVISGGPFKLNNCLCFKAFIERNDHIQIGYTHMYFYRNGLSEKKENTLLLNQENTDIFLSDLTILLEGETGTGKGHLAEQIHHISGRPGKFIQTNLCAYNASLLESELFGHKKGSFTGAFYDKKGALRNAHKGTLFLDEVDSLPLEIQTKLLLFLDSKKLSPVGSDYEEKVDVRLIVASGKNLRSCVDSGLMRADFYFRISSAIRIKLDTLRERKELILDFCESYAKKYGLNISKELLAFYQTLAWPGNFRELLGHLEKKRFLSKTHKIDFDKYDQDLLRDGHKSSFKYFDYLPLKKMKNLYIKEVYHSLSQDLSQTASILQTSTATIKQALRI